MIVDEYQIRYFSPALKVEQQRILENNFEVAASFDPYNHGSGVVPKFDPQDAFYAPLTGFAALNRPGPKIRIFRRRSAVSAFR